MKIKSLSLLNYRNYEKATISLSDGINVIVGKNAQGKTNLIESIFLCAIGKSPRTTKDKDLILWNQKNAKIDLVLEKNVGKTQIEIFLFDNQNKAIRINKVGIKKLGLLLGNLNAIYFSPDELKLIKDSPEERRRFMDIDLCQFNRNYFYNLSTYNKILAERNKLLKNPEDSMLKDTISIWNEQLSSAGAKIILDRLKLLKNLSVHAKNIHFSLTDNAEDLELSYVGFTGENFDELKNTLLKKYDESLEKDLHLGFTTVGPHRDDIKISSNGIDLRSFGSQGQQRTASLSLKLAELEFFKDEIGEYPVLLLDDVLSELDENRQNKLLQYVKNMQTLITCTQFDFSIPHTTFVVNNGNITLNQPQ